MYPEWYELPELKLRSVVNRSHQGVRSSNARNGIDYLDCWNYTLFIGKHVVGHIRMPVRGLFPDGGSHQLSLGNAAINTWQTMPSYEACIERVMERLKG